MMSDALPTRVFLVQGKKANKDFKAARTLYPLQEIHPNQTNLPPALLRQDATLSEKLPATPTNDKEEHSQHDQPKEARHDAVL